jgi:cytochrome P450 family 142 subfamily A polypeptide 1
VGLNLLDREFYAGDPHAVFKAMRAQEPVYHDDETGLWALLLHEDVVWGERNREILSSAPGSRPLTPPQPSMIDSDDPLHLRRRHQVDRAFAKSRVPAYEDWIRSIVVELLDAIAPKGEADIVRDLASPLPTAVIADLLGVRKEDRGTLQHWSDVMVSGADGPANVTQDVLDAAAAYYAYMNQVIDDRRSSPRDDLISVLVHANDGGLSPEEIWGEALLLLVGGNETTRNVISGGIEALISNPEQRQILIDDPSKIPAAVEECIRWVTPVINMARTATCDIELRGRTIPQGDEVLLMYTSANRDERVFDEPERFDVSREPNAHVAFGYGTHYCLGAGLARLEIRVLLEEVLARIPDMEMKDARAEVRRTRSSFIRGLLELPVTFPPKS